MHPAFTDPCLGVVRASLSFSCRCAGLIWIIRCSRCSLARFAPPVQHHRKTVKHLPHHCDVKSWMLSDLSQPTPSQAKAERETSSYTKQRWRAETHPTCTLSWISARICSKSWSVLCCVSWRQKDATQTKTPNWDWSTFDPSTNPFDQLRPFTYLFDQLSRRRRRRRLQHGEPLIQPQKLSIVLLHHTNDTCDETDNT